MITSSPSGLSIWQVFKQSPLPYLLRSTWRLARGLKLQIVVYVLMFIAAQSVQLLEPLAIANLLNIIQANEPNLLHSILIGLGLYAGIFLAFWILHYPARVMERRVSFIIKLRCKEELFERVTHFDLEWHKDHHSGDSIDKINRASLAIDQFVGTGFLVIYMFGSLMGAQIALAIFMWPAAVVSMIGSALALTVIFGFDRLLFQQFRGLNAIENRTASAIHDYVTNIVTVIMLRLERRVKNEVVRRMFSGWNLFKKNVIANELKWWLTSLIITSMIVSVLIWYANHVISSNLVFQAGTFFALFEYLRRVGLSFQQFAMNYGNIVRQAADVRSAETILQSEDSIRDRKLYQEIPSTWREIRVSNLSFGYSPNKLQLENINMSLSRGEKIALVGESGSGKSTLMSIIRGLRRADTATVECDGNPVHSGILALKHITTLIPQDPEIFADTISTNVSFGVTASKERIADAIQLARFAEVVSRLPNGVETNIAEKGVNLSGGERQRLALARGLFFARDSAVVLLDESTSSVDVFNERLIYQSIRTEFKEQCIVSSIHKLHLLEFFDTVCVLKGGQIIEQGAPDFLKRAGGELTRLWRLYEVEEAQETSSNYSQKDEESWE